MRPGQLRPYLPAGITTVWLKKRRRSWLASLAALLLVSLPPTLVGAPAVDVSKLPPAAVRVVDFVTDIRPIFEKSCQSCHGAEKQKGDYRLDSKAAALKGGESFAPAIKPGDSAGSPLIQLVAGLVPDSKMPAKGDPLTAEQIGLVRAWIDQGAHWPEQGEPARDLHWSFKPVLRPSVPTANTRSPIANPIDAFVRDALTKNKLTPSREADRRTLIRRLYFDLIGLPPTPGEVRAFEQDRSRDAYEKLVEKLLASPHHGERWARHWLDVVRFAETTGFEVNTPRANAWPYRDYVIRAFNDDKPYDRFITEQLAGDVLGEDAATGFLVAGPDDKVKSPDPVLTSNQRADELHDIVSTTSSAFLGLTVGCARCHNHKFDPIPQTDYYALKAVFEGVAHGDRKLRTDDSAAQEQEMKERRARLAEIDAQLIDLEPFAQVGSVDTKALRSAVHPRQNLERFQPVTARKVRFTILQTSDAEPCIDELEIYTAEAKPRNIALASAGTKASASGTYPNSDLHRLEHISDGKLGNSRSWISNERGKGWVELEFPETVTINRILWARDRNQQFTDRLATNYRIEVASGSNDWQVVASSIDRLPYQAGKPTSPTSVAGLKPEEAATAKKLLAEKAEHEARLASFARDQMIYGGTFNAKPEPTYRLHRGDAMQRREVIGPGALQSIPVKFALPVKSAAAPKAEALTENQQRRTSFAQWVVSTNHPLTARVMVNRLWQYYFGEGLVNTSSDLGANGGRPTHPELLDWLAAEFMQPTVAMNGKPGTPWSLKHLHRLIVTSATYRQSSASRKEYVAIDSGSLLLWRFPPRRLEAEPIRDLILSVSGKLDLRMGGPGFGFFEPNDNYVRVYTPKQEFGPETWRRMVYGTVVRQRPDGVFGVFDCPDGGQIAPKRTRSTTPLQALNLLNSGFMLQQAGFFAGRLEKEAGKNPEAQARRAFALAFQREPDRAELQAASKLIQEQGLTVFCRALLNASEFVYVF